jgi:putative peptidoglycan lipid II flippase
MSETTNKNGEASGEDAAAGAKPQAAPPRFVGHAVLVSALTLVSRFAGLGRDAVLAAALGLSVAADAFFIGFLVPNLFRRLFGEGALTAAFIPHYTDLLERDPALAKRFATLTLTLLSVLLVGVTLIAEAALWLIAARLDETHKASLAVYYTRLMLPYMPLICAVALVGGVLQVHKRFGPPAAAPLVLNGVIVAAVLLATSLFSRDTAPRTVATWVAVGVVVAGVLQLAWQAAVLLRVTGLSSSFRGCWPTMRAMLVMMGPMVVGLAVFQINALLDALIAFFFAPPEGGAGASAQLTAFGQTFTAPLRNGDVAALNWSQRLYQFPLGVFGIAIATAIFPALSAAAAKFNHADDAQPNARAKPRATSEEFAEIVRHGLRLTLFIGLPASVGLILVRVPLARAVFEHGGFTTGDALRVSVILAGYASSVWAYSMTHTLTRAFYALKDATTPLKVSACMVALNLTLNLTLIWPLGAAGLAWSTATSAAGQVTLLLMLLRRRVDKPIDRSVATSWARTALASAVMAGVLLPITWLIDPAALSWWASTGLLITLVVLGGAVVLGVGLFSNAEELRWLRKRSVK